MPLENWMKRIKSPDPLAPEIEKLAEDELKELEHAGVELKGLFHLLEPEALRIAKAYADFYIARYESDGKKLMQEDPNKFAYWVSKGTYNSDGSLPENRKQNQFRMGLTQKAFEIFLQQIQVPYIPNDPTVDWRPQKGEPKDTKSRTTEFSYDFYIPLFGEIDIKSSILTNPDVNINCREFNAENPDYVVTYMILNMNEPRWLKMVGYMHSRQIREYESILYEGKPESRRFWKIPASDFEKQEHDGHALLMRLMIVRHVIKELESHPIHEFF